MELELTNRYSKLCEWAMNADDNRLFFCEDLGPTLTTIWLCLLFLLKVLERRLCGGMVPGGQG